MGMNKMQIRVLLAVLVITGFFLMVGVLTFISIPQENGDVLKILVGFLGGITASVVSHYFGTSEG
jgi:hypothetical protein